MSFINNNLSFNILETNECKTLGILDTSSYRTPNDVSGLVLQILPPNGLDLVETNYNQSTVTIINSNTLKITKVADPKYLQELPDGLYTAKISICPYETNWTEKKWYRVCQLQCKFSKAFLKAKINECSSCLDLNISKKLESAWEYIIGVETNVTACNFPEAARCYEKANKIIDKILDCGC